MPDKRIPRRRWRIALLLACGVLVNYFDRVNLSVAHNALYAAFGISDITYGYLLGAYNWTYALCQLPVGVLLDRFGVRRVGRISTFLWSMASFAAALTPNIGGFFAARFLLGIGEAPTFPANAKAVGYWFPAKERSFATALFDAQAKFASAIGVPLIGLLLLRIGWRLSFAATGLISFCYFLLFSLVYRDPKEDDGLTEAESRYIAEADAGKQVYQPNEHVSLGYLLRRKKVIGLALGFGSYNYVFYLLLTWLPSYLSRSLHMDLMQSFLYTGVPWIAATVTDLMIGGWLVDALIQRGWNADLVRRVVLISGTALGLGIFGAAYAHSSAQALFWISLSISGLAAAAPVGWSVPSLIAPRGSVGKLGGILNFANQVSGIAAPVVTGYLVSAQHSFALAFGVAAAYLAAGIAGYIFLLGKIEPIPAEAGPESVA
ncbi:MAG: MFS transporter [Bacillota bacterium]|nr:MFS transporter [Bacillota bacterium]